MNYRSVLTTCPYCGCGCRFFLQVVDGKLVGVQPCKSDEISQGRLCIKGYNAHAFVQNKDRLTDPLVARDGRFEKASWEDAVECARCGGRGCNRWPRSRRPRCSRPSRR